MAVETTTEQISDVASFEDPGRPPAHSVDLAFQLGYAVRLALAVMVGAAVAAGVAYALLAREFHDYARNVTILSAGQDAAPQVAIVSALVQIVLTGALLALIALLASHKIAGPTRRMVRLLREVRQGKLPGPVKCRQGDQVGRLEIEFNELSRALSERHAHLRRSLEEVRATQEELRRALANREAREEQRVASDRLNRQAAALARALDEARSNNA